MINFRLDRNQTGDLLCLAAGRYPLTEETAREICGGGHPSAPCTQVYGAYANGNGKSELVAIMTATYSIVFPHKDGSRMCHVSGAYTREDMRHQGYASALMRAIERDAAECFHADYLCCDSTADALYRHMGFVPAPEDETRLWKKL